MVNRLIDEVNKALEHELYMAALCTVLTIPDMCAKAEYPQLSNKRRYIKWYEELIGKYERDSEAPNMPYLSGEVVYQLRCSVLHQGTPNIDKNHIREDCCKIDKFIIRVERTKEFGGYADSASYMNTESPNREYTVNVQRLCMMITRVAKKYYENNKEKFDFINFSIQDWDAIIERRNKRINDF